MKNFKLLIATVLLCIFFTGCNQRSDVVSTPFQNNTIFGIQEVARVDTELSGIENESVTFSLTALFILLM